jgi:hypothetical protein
MCSRTPNQLLSFRLHTLALPKASLSLKRTSTRRTREHCLGVFKNGEVFLAPPPNVVSVSTSTHLLFSLSLSLSLSV